MRWPVALARGVMVVVTAGLLWTTLSAQYVRRSQFPTEHSRRMQYRLDDWISILPAHHFTSISVGTNYLYFSSLDGGIWRYNLYQNEWDYPFTTSNGLPSNRVFQVVYDASQNVLWAVTDVDTAVFDFAAEEWKAKKEMPFWNYRFPRSALPDSGKSLPRNRFLPREFLRQLPVFIPEGNFTLDANWQLIDTHLREYPITGFLIDDWERIWFTVEGLGLGKGNILEQRARFFPLGLANIHPRVVQFQGDDLWIGGITAGVLSELGTPSESALKGIVRWRNQDGGWQYYDARFISRLFSDQVTAMATTTDAIWFGTDYGVARYFIHKNKWQTYYVKHGLYSNRVSDVLVAGDDVWVATDEGLNVIDRVTGRVKKVRYKWLNQYPVYRLAMQNDTLWVAAFAGIFRRFPDTGKWQKLTTRAAIADQMVTALDYYQGEMWFATAGGVMRYDIARDKWESFPQLQTEGLGRLWHLAADSAAVWIATDAGLLKFDRKRQYWKLFTTVDGLLDNRCRYVLINGDYLWIATVSGITQFYWNSPARID